MNLPKILPEWLGANLLIRDIPKLTQLPPCTRLAFSSGAVACVEKPGFINEGDAVFIEVPQQVVYTLPV